MICGIAGSAQSGKDTIGTILQFLMFKDEYHRTSLTYVEYMSARKNFHETSEIVKFATKLKQIVNILTGISMEDLEKEEVKQSYYSTIHGLYYALEDVPVGKTIISDVADYMNYLEEYDVTDIYIQVRVLLQYEGTEIGRDMRGYNSWVNATFASYKDQNWIITDVRFPNEADAIVNRGGFLIKVVRDTDAISKHVSETALNDYKGFHAIIDNDGTIEDLVTEVTYLYNNIIKPFFTLAKVDDISGTDGI